MNFQGLQAKYSRLMQENAAWRLLRVDNSVYILAFLEELFSEESEVPFARARVLLEANLGIAKDLGIWDTEVTAAAYLRQWSDAGWLRDMDDCVSMTDASEQALRFAKSLSQRSIGTSASHLRIVQDNVRDLSIKLSTNPEERIKGLEKQILELEIQIENIRAGFAVELTEAQQREALRELFQQASILPGDFRWVEDEMRNLDRDIRVEMIQDGTTRGDILGKAIEYEERLAETESGSAFYGFHELLQDENRSMELRQELQIVLSSEAARFLTKNQLQQLKYLIRNLNQESDRVLDVRRRHTKGLRSYIESGAAFESQAVNRLLGELEKKAIQLRDAEIKPSIKIDIELRVGRAEIYTPTAISLKRPEDIINTADVEEYQHSGAPGAAILEAMQTVQVREVANRTRELVKREGPMTISGVTEIMPITKGLEELTALVRVAKAINSVRLEEKENVRFIDKQGIEVVATLPRFLISAELFPDDLEELNL